MKNALVYIVYFLTRVPLLFTLYSREEAFASVSYLDDVRVDGTILGGTDSATCDTTVNPPACLSIDPRGGIKLSREKSPNQIMSHFLIYRKNASTGHLEEGLRIGMDGDGFPFFGFNSSGDVANMYFRKGTDYLKIYMCGDNGSCGILIKDNSGALKYTNPSGTTTTLAN